MKDFHEPEPTDEGLRRLLDAIRQDIRNEVLMAQVHEPVRPVNSWHHGLTPWMVTPQEAF